MQRQNEKKELSSFRSEHLKALLLGLVSTVSPRKGVLERRKVLTVISATINTFIAKGTQSLCTHQSIVGQGDRFFKLLYYGKKTFRLVILG